MDKSKLITWNLKEVILNKNLLGPAIGLLVAFSSFFYSQRGVQVGLTQGGDPLKTQEIFEILSSGNRIPTFKFIALIQELGHRADHLFDDRVNQLMQGTGNIEAITVIGYRDSSVIFELTGNSDEIYLSNAADDLNVTDYIGYSYLVKIDSITAQGCQSSRTLAFSSQAPDSQIDAYILDYSYENTSANFTDAFASSSFFSSEKRSYQTGAAAESNFLKAVDFCTKEG